MINRQNYIIITLNFIINIILIILKSGNKAEKLILSSSLLKLDER